MLLFFLLAFCLPGLSSLFCCVFPFHPSGFGASLCFRSFLLGSSSALVCPLVWSVSPLGFYFPCSFQVPRSSSSLFLSAFSYCAFVSALIQVVLFLVSCLCPSGSYPLGGVLCCFIVCGAFFHFPVLPASSFPLLPQSLRLSLASLSAFFQGCFFVSCLSLAFFS